MKSICRQDRRGIAFRVLCDSHECQRTIDLSASGTHGILGRAEEKRIEFVAETWRPPVWDRQSRHPVIDSIGYGRADHGDVRVNGL
jgi:hypothetical protein